MNRILLILLLFCVCLSACTKTNDVPAQVRAQGVIDSAIITTYLKNNGLPEKHVDTTGVYYIIDTLGTGTDVITNSTQITVGYTATLLTSKSTLGPVFAQTDIPGGTDFHPSFVLGATIRGWQLGVPQIKKGGTVTLFVPSRYAYGPYPQPQLGLPANAVLIFNITLYNITN